jgi:Concanavalin A-like lectin/glucanases superfamily
MRFLYLLLPSIFSLTTFAQIPTSGNVLWLKADAAVYTDAGVTAATNGQTVAQWNDQSGNTANATSAAAIYRPTYITNVINSKPVLRFSNHYLQTPNIDLSTTDKTDMYVLYKSVAPNSNWECVAEHGADYNSIIGFNLFENAQGQTYSGMFAGMSGGGYNHKDYPFKANEFKMVNTSFDKAAAANAKVNLRINTKDITLYAQSAAASSGNFANNPLYIGNRGSTLAYPLSGDIAEIILYNRKLTLTEKLQIESYLNTKYNITCNVTTPMPGSGNCLQMGNYGAYAQDDADIDFGSNDFTVEFWTMKRALSNNSSNSACINKWNTGTVPGSNEWAITTSNDGNDNFPTFYFESGTTIYKAIGASSLTTNKWYHIAAVREGNNLKIYVNGILEGTTAIPPGASVNNVAARTYMAMGYYPAGLSNNSNLDELRIWNTALSQTTIRDWMCKKETSLHPNHAMLTRYYKFDEQNGTIFGNQINNCTTEAYSNGGILATSGAPIGNNSNYNYTANTATANINISTASDNLAVAMNAGTSDGVHVYGVNELPNNQNYPGLGGNDKYAGVFVVNGNGTAAYNATYNYTNNTAVTPANEPTLKLFKRTDNAATTWSVADNQTLNTGTKTITATGQNTEYVLASAVTPVPPTCALNLTGVVGTSTRIPYSTALNLTAAYTYEVWVKPSTNISTYRVVLGRYATAVHNPTIEIEASGSGYDGKVSVWLHVGGVYKTLYSNTAVNDNQWHHIATTYDGAEMKLYIDGVLESSLAATGAITSSTDPLTIGYSMGFNLYPFIGKIDEVRIWDVARNLSQISATMNTTLAGNEASLVAYYDFNNGTYNGNGQTVTNKCTTTGTILNGLTTGTASTPTFDCPNTPLPTFVAPTCAAKFNGTNSYVDVVNTATSMPPTGTIEFWMNQPSFSDWQIPFSTFSPSVNAGTFTDGMYFQTYANGNLYFIYASSYSVYGIELFGTLAPNKNYHVALSWDLSTQTIRGYLDGKLIFNKALTTTFPTSIPRLTLGGGFANGRFYNGTLDEVRYWNVERTQNQLIGKASDSLVGNDAGLRAYYRFNDNSSNGAGQIITNYATATGAALNGITVNFVKFPCTINPPTCSITLSGAASEGVQIPHNAAFNSTTNVTYEAWVKPSTNVAAYRRIIGKGGNGTQEAPGMYVQQGTGKLTAGMLINGTQQIVTSSIAINDNEWHHTAFTYDGTTLKLYVDGTLDGIQTAAGTITTNASPVDIGYNSPLNLYPFVGKIDEVRIWNTTRTLSQIQAAMSGSLLGNEAGLVAYYHFNNNSRSGQSRTVTNICTATGSALNGSTFGTALTPIFECAPPPFTTPECNMVLNGTTDYAQATNNVAINLTQFSVGAYFKTTNTGAVKTIIMKDVEGTNNNYKLSISATNKVQISFVNTAFTTVSAIGTTTVTDGNWHYAVGTYDGTSLKIYVDGVLETTTANATTAVTGSFALNIGIDNGGINKFNGSLDELSVWNRSISATEIISLVGQRLIGNESGLVVYYNFAGMLTDGVNGPTYVTNSCTNTGSPLNAQLAGTITTPKFTCSEIPLTDPPCAILLNGYTDAVKATNGTNPVTYPTISQNFTMEIVAKPLLEKRESGAGGYPIWPPGHYLQNGQVGQTYVIPPDDGTSFGAGHAAVGISLGTNGIGIYEGASGYLQAPAVYNAPVADWTHITVVSENNKLKLYVNGALKYSAVASGFVLHPSIGLAGYSSALSGSYAGYVSEVRVWNTARTSDEIRNNVNVNLTGAEANLVSLYKFGSNSINGNNQIITGSGSMAGSIVYKTIGSTYTPLFTCANTTIVPKDTLPGSGKMLNFTGSGLYSAFNGYAFAELGNWGNTPAQGSIALWFNTNNIKNNAVLFSTTHFRNQTGKHKGFDVFIKNNKLLLTIGTDTTVIGYQDTVIVLNSITANKWNHLTLTWNAGANAYEVFINGLSIASGTSSFLPTKFESVKVGSGIVAGYAYAWDGLIDELSEWNKILTATEIKQQMCSKINTIQSNYANVLHYYRFDNNTTGNNFITDYAGTAHGIYCLPFLFDYTIYGNGGLFFQDQIPSHYFIDLPTSSAPIGDTSRFDYSGIGSFAKVTTGITNKDTIEATMLSGSNVQGIHVYGVNEKPNTQNGQLVLTNNNRYGGVYVVGDSNQVSYNMKYSYSANPHFTAGLFHDQLLLYKRQHNADGTWILDLTAIIDSVTKTYTTIAKNNEFMLGYSLVPVRPHLGPDTTVYIICDNETYNLLPLYNTGSFATSWSTGTPTAATLGSYSLIATSSFGFKDTAVATVAQKLAVWTGAVSSDWHTAANWNGNKMPDSTYHVIIPLGTANPCVISSANAFAASIQAKTSSNFAIINNKILLIAASCGALPVWP